mmetsp:Transcript_8795/g.13110  ORF Transcript_8795/g.13110 Transcript_8795/m.13110 type:complete len:89 (+) Transcript_8795:2380-2646(+)
MLLSDDGDVFVPRPVEDVASVALVKLKEPGSGGDLCAVPFEELPVSSTLFPLEDPPRLSQFFATISGVMKVLSLSGDSYMGESDTSIA